MRDVRLYRGFKAGKGHSDHGAYGLYEGCPAAIYYSAHIGGDMWNSANSRVFSVLLTITLTVLAPASAQQAKEKQFPEDQKPQQALEKQFPEDKAPDATGKKDHGKKKSAKSKKDKKPKKVEEEKK